MHAYASHQTIQLLAADTRTGTGTSPQLLIMIGAAAAALLFIGGMRLVFVIISGLAEFAERLVGGIVRGGITVMGVGALGAVAFVGYVVTYVLPGRST